MSDAKKTLIIGFVGNAMQLAMPVRWVLSGLNPTHHLHAKIADPLKDGFAHGPPDLAGVARTVGQKLDRGQYARVVGLGHSAGAPVAIAAALVNGWERAIVVVPLRMSEHPKQTAQFEAIIEQFPEPAAWPRLTGVRGTRRKEVQAIRQLRRLVPKLKVLVEEVHAKNVLYFAFMAGRLPDLLSRVISDDEWPKHRNSRERLRKR